ncbi:MAG: 3-methyladenine glycosylase, partial [Pseudonocardiales bacterium]|nr:3-methyladenine glycosylase [Pseudonocardiales bacterium]
MSGDRWSGRERRWSPGRPVDIARTLGPLRRGTADPAHSVGPDGFWWAARTPDGPGTLLLRTSTGAANDVHATAGDVHATANDVHATANDVHATANDVHATANDVHATALGPGADWLLDRVPTLLCVDDDWSTLDVSGWP